MRVLAAVSVGHARKNELSVFAGIERDLGDTWEVLAQRVQILLRLCTQTVKIDLLIEIEVRRGPFTRARVARIVEARSVRVPRQAAARGSPIHAWNYVRERT